MGANNEKMLIIGCSQVGRAIFDAMKHNYEILEHDIVQVKRRNKKTRNYSFIDVKTDPKDFQGGYMHICFPHSDKFHEEVIAYNKLYNPKLIIIHSSIPVGTTKILSNVCPIVHSPVIFDDNNFPSITLFRKLIGYDVADYGLMAEEHLRKCFNTALVKGSANTELADLMLNLYAMTCRAVTFEIGVVFKLLGLDYKVLGELMHYNNIGYSRLNKEHNFLQNITLGLNKSDFRTKLIDLLPKKMQSLFFKLAMNSYELEEKEKNNAKSK